MVNPEGYRCLCPVNERCQTLPTSIPTTTMHVSSVSSTEIGKSVSTSQTIKSSQLLLPTIQPSRSFSKAGLSQSSFSSVATPKVSIKMSSASSNARSSFSPSPLNRPTSAVSTLTSISLMPGEVCSVSNPCENGGRCTVDGVSYKCVCAGYFAGQLCSKDISKFYVSCFLLCFIVQSTKEPNVVYLIEG